MPLVWSEVAGVWRRYCREVLPNGQHGLPSLVDLLDEIDVGLAEGRPFARALCEVHQTDASHAASDGYQDEEWGPFLSRSFLVFAVLRRYIRTLTKAAGKRIHLVRAPDGMPDYGGSVAGAGRPWFQFQCETGRTAMYCPVPSCRRMRLRRQIVVLKTLWDVSSNHRARRLLRMVLDNLSDMV